MVEHKLPMLVVRVRFPPPAIASALMRRTHRVVLGLGSNWADSPRRLRDALEKLDGIVGGMRCSKIYTSAPFHAPDQPSYSNAVVVGHTNLPPLQLLAELKAIEIAMGRDLQAERYSARPIDLDIIDYDNVHMVFARKHSGGGRADPVLTLPHPRCTQRWFVLQPWCALEPRRRLSLPPPENQPNRWARKTPSAGKRINKERLPLARYGKRAKKQCWVARWRSMH